VVQLGTSQVPTSLATGQAGGRRAAYAIVVRSVELKADSTAYGLEVLRPYMAILADGARFLVCWPPTWPPAPGVIPSLAAAGFTLQQWGVAADYDMLTDWLRDYEGTELAVLTFYPRGQAATPVPLRMVGLGTGEKPVSLSDPRTRGREPEMAVFVRLGPVPADSNVWMIGPVQLYLGPQGSIKTAGRFTGGGCAPDDAALEAIVREHFAASGWGDPGGYEMFEDLLLDNEGYPVLLITCYPARPGAVTGKIMVSQGQAQAQLQPQPRAVAQEPAAAPVGWRAWPIAGLPQEAQKLLQEAVAVVERQVDLASYPDIVAVRSTGSGGAVMEAVAKIEQAAALAPDSLDVALARVAALRLAAQGESAATALREMASRWPGHWAAQCLLHHPAQCPLKWPAWPEDGALHPGVVRLVQTIVPWEFRDGLLPLVVFLTRTPTDEGVSEQEFMDSPLELALPDTGERGPLVLACVFRLGGTASDPLVLEALGYPGESSLAAIRWEMVCRRKVFGLANVRGGKVIGVREVRLGPQGSKTADMLADPIAQETGGPVSLPAVSAAVGRYQQRFPIETLPFEPAG